LQQEVSRAEPLWSRLADFRADAIEHQQFSDHALWQVLQANIGPDQASNDGRVGVGVSSLFDDFHDRGGIHISDVHSWADGSPMQIVETQDEGVFDEALELDAVVP